MACIEQKERYAKYFEKRRREKKLTHKRRERNIETQKEIEGKTRKPEDSVEQAKETHKMG